MFSRLSFLGIGCAVLFLSACDVKQTQNTDGKQQETSRTTRPEPNKGQGPAQEEQDEPLETSGDGQQQKIPLRVYTTRNFAKDVGPFLKEAFEKEYPLCEILYYTGTNPINVVASLDRLEEKPDILMEVTYDFFQSLPPEKKKQLFLKLDLLPSLLTLKPYWDDPYILPISHTFLGFVYHEEDFKDVSLPQNLEALTQLPDKSIVLIDPRTSNTGFSFLLWVKAVYGDKAKDYWQRLKPKILTITKGWADAYTLFLKRQAPLVLSYTLSPAYHQVVEKRHDIKAAIFQEGHYPDIYTAAVFKQTQQPFFAKAFVRFLLSQSVQRAIALNDWTYPVVALDEPLPQAFAQDVKPLSPISSQDIRRDKQDWIEEWLEALS